MITFGISTPFGMLSPTKGQVAYALLTRSPLRKFNIKHSRFLAACVVCFGTRSKNFCKRKFLPLLSNDWTLYVELSPFDLHVLGMPPAFVLSQDQTLQKKLFFEEPIWLLLLKEINLTWSSVQGTLDPHIRFLIGSMFSFERTNFKCLATLALIQCRIASTCI